jgi:adenosylhomocysteinase
MARKEPLTMEPSRIRDPRLAASIEEGEIAWLRHVSPITDHFCRRIEKRDYRGKRLAYWGHITFQNIITMMPALQQAGAEIAIGACNVDSTNDAVAAWAAARGMHVYGWQGMSRSDYEENLRTVRRFNADYLCDMGGELCVAYLDRSPPVRGALEATTSGLTLLRRHTLTFPVFEWNSIPLKDRLENRFHVGDGVWPVFSSVTGLSLFGRRVLVVGYGPVGKGIAERARDLGAIPYVADLDPVKLIEARHHGCETIHIEEGLSRCEIAVTATGVEGVLRADHLRRARDGIILFNAGHSSREIDIDWLYRQPHERMKAHIERFTIGSRHLFLLAQGSLLNLAASTGLHGNDLFDHYTAVMLLGVAWMFDSLPGDVAPGLHLYPAHLEKEIATLSVDMHDRLVGSIPPSAGG